MFARWYPHKFNNYSLLRDCYYDEKKTITISIEVRVVTVMSVNSVLMTGLF